MEDDSDLQSYANTIEATLCLWDSHYKGALSDDAAIKVIEMLLDRYYYNDPEIGCGADSVLLEGLDMVLQSMVEDLTDVPGETILKVLGVMHFVARRRTRGGREYFDIIHQYVGLRGGPGIRILPNSIK